MHRFGRPPEFLGDDAGEIAGADFARLAGIFCIVREEIISGGNDFNRRQRIELFAPQFLYNADGRFFSADVFLHEGAGRAVRKKFFDCGEHRRVAADD